MMLDLVQLVILLSSRDFGIAEAERYFAPASSKRGVVERGFENRELWTSDGTAVTLEILHDDLLGVRLRTAVPVDLDLTVLSEAWGESDRMPGAVDGFEPFDHWYQFQRSEYRFLVMVSPEDDTAGRMVPVREVIIRRMREDGFRAETLRLPNRWDSEDALVELVLFLLGEVAPQPNLLFGRLGTFESRTAAVDRLLGMEGQNVTEARLTNRSVARRGEDLMALGALDLHTVEVDFVRPVPISVEHFAVRLGARREGGSLVLERGTVVLSLTSAGSVARVRIERQ